MKTDRTTDAQPAQVFITPPGDNQRRNEADGMNLMEYYYMIRSRPLLFLVFPVAFSVAAIVYVMTATPRYKSSCKLLVEKSGAKVTNIQDVYDPTSGVRDFDTFIQTQLKLIASREILVKVFDRFGFAERPEYRDHPDPLSIFLAGVFVRAEPDTFLVDVGYESIDPQEAADVANAIAETYSEVHRQRRLGISGSGLEKLRQQLEEIRKARKESSEALNAFKKKHRIINLNDAQRLLVQRMSSIDEALIEARIEESRIKAVLDVMGNSKADVTTLNAFPQSMMNSTITAIKLEKLRAEAKLPELLSRYGKVHDTVKTQYNVIKTLEAAFKAEIQQAVAGLQSDHERAKMRTALLRQELESLKTESLGLDQVAGEYRVLEDASLAADKSYRMLINRINEINIAKNADDLKGAGTVEVVSKAIPSTRAFFPQRKRTVLLAGFVGLALGAGLCILLGLLDTTVKCKEEVEDLLGRLPTLGTVPPFAAGEDQLQALKDNHGSLAEAFRHVRVSLGLSILGRDKKVFAVTSSQPGEGKTTTAFNLALSLARDGKRVLLMECDMRRPSLTKVLGEKAPSIEKGVSNVLIGDATLEDVRWTFPEADSLDIAFCGPVPPNPAELLGTDRLKEVLGDARESYDRVIIDAPPVLNVADTSIIAGLGVPLIGVVRLFSTSRHQLTRMKEQIETVQGQVAGFVLNNAMAPKRGYYGYYYGGRYYTYSDYQYEK